MKTVMYKKSLEETLEYLISQRDGTNPGHGVFYKILEDAFMFLKNQSIDEGRDYCNPYNKEIAYAIYGDGSAHTTMVRKTLDFLCKLGNIKIVGNGEDRKIYIIKDLEF